MTILVADDHKMFAESLKVLLEPDYEIVGLVSNGQDAVKAARTLRPDIVILDVGMPLLNGIDAALKIRADLPNAKLIAVTMNADPALVSKAFRAGITAYVLKNEAATELVDAVGAAVRNQTYISKDLSVTIPALLKNDEKRGKDYQELTSRQREIIQLLAEGRAMKEIADILGISARTVAEHKYRIMSHLNLKTNSAIYAYALKHGLIATASGPTAQPEISTFFAKPGRSPHNEIVEQLKRTVEDPCVKVVLEAVTGFVLILNENRQILAANQEFLQALSMDGSCPIGLRMGEALNCMHFSEGPDGCGTSLHCRACGALLTVLASQKNGKTAEGECRLEILREGQLTPMELKVRSSPLELGGHKLTAFVFYDIGNIKRREALDQTFLHDFLNTIGGLEGWSRRLKSASASTAAREIVALAEQLKEEVLSQRMLLGAESGELKAKAVKCEVSSVMERLKTLFEYHQVAQNRQLIVTAPPEDIHFYTDPSILTRVLVNMLKNAFEATAPGGKVTLRFEMKHDIPVFLVHNASVISEAIKPHIFERSFSTRSEPGRGLGAYSMKLYGERFLRGKVAFTSVPRKGTTFWISLPADSVSVGRREADKQSRSLPAAAKASADRLSAGRILLVNDHIGRLRLTALMLNRIGYEAVCCCEAEEALRRFEEDPDSFGAVITDMTMPSVNGIELAKKLTSGREVPVALWTGITEAVSEEEARSAGIVTFLREPFTVTELAERVGQLI